jgi:ankyrin repeat protein
VGLQILLLFFLAIARLGAPIARCQDASGVMGGAAHDADGWHRLPSFPFPVWMTSAPAESVRSANFRVMYLFLPTPDFNQENLCHLFRTLSGQVPRPIGLTIIAFSDRDMLKRQMDASSDLYDPTDGIKGGQARVQSAESHRPASTGYFRATYYRSGSEDHFRYSEHAESERYTWIEMRPSPHPDVAMNLLESIEDGDVEGTGKLITKDLSREVRRRTRNGLIRFQPRRNKRETVRLLVEVGENINEIDEGGLTPLMRACENGDPDLARAFLDNGANLNAQTTGGRSALIIAARKGASELVRLLVERGCDVDQAPGNYGTTALMVAAGNGDIRSIGILLSKRADPNRRNAAGQTALFFASPDDCEPIVALLCGAGADLNSRDNSGETPLMRAVYSHHERLVRVLLDRGAHAGLRNTFGTSALDIARRRFGPKDAITQLLMQ